LKINLFIKDSLKEIAKKNFVLKNGMMGKNMKLLCKIILFMVKANFSILTEIFMKDNCRKVCQMVLEFSYFQMEINMKEIGFVINIKDMARLL